MFSLARDLLPTSLWRNFPRGTCSFVPCDKYFLDIDILSAIERVFAELSNLFLPSLFSLSLSPFLVLRTLRTTRIGVWRLSFEGKKHTRLSSAISRIFPQPLLLFVKEFPGEIFQLTVERRLDGSFVTCTKNNEVELIRSVSVLIGSCMYKGGEGGGRILQLYFFFLSLWRAFWFCLIAHAVISVQTFREFNVYYRGFC